MSIFDSLHKHPCIFIITIIFSSILLTNIAAQDYSSKFLEKKHTDKVEIYFAETLDKLSYSFYPKPIRYISSENFDQYRTIDVKGILFTYKNPAASQVFLVSEIDNFKKRRMKRNDQGVWYYILVLKPYLDRAKVEKVRYRFLVDGMFINNRKQALEITPSENIISTYNQKPKNFLPVFGVNLLKGKSGQIYEYLFRVKIPNASRVSLVGNFNNWNHELDIMQKVSDGVFEFRKLLPQGEYIYLYKTRDEYYVDPYNPHKRGHHVYRMVSYINVP